MAEDYKEVRVTLDLTVSGDTVSQGSSSNNVPTAPNEPNGETTSDKKLTNKQKGANQALALALQYAKKTAVSAVGNYGDMTGDYETAQKLQGVTNAAMTVATIIANPVVGFISTAYQVGSSIYNDIATRQKQKRIAAFNAERVGYTQNRS